MGVGFNLVSQSPPSFNWCGNGLQNNGGSPGQILWNAVGTSPVYISPNGATTSILQNQKGSWTYVFLKTGKTTGTTTGTCLTTTSFTDSVSTGTGTTNYYLTITDTNTGIATLFKNSVNWGIL
jgi:hypothetical protein